MAMASTVKLVLGSIAFSKHMLPLIFQSLVFSLEQWLLVCILKGQTCLNTWVNCSPGRVGEPRTYFVEPALFLPFPVLFSLMIPLVLF
ncbi:hypothetical protein CsSME_00030143 [Camellia sinensis var. sinensis]